MKKIPRPVWTLGIVSLLMDASSELIHSLLPIYIVSVLGASASSLGWLEGLSEATASIVKLFSGIWSDWLGRRKLVVLIGYGMAALSKPLFPLASSMSLVVGARLFDRFGKGIRGAPRDALIADVSDPSIRGAAFGLRQSLDTVGAILGPLAALLVLSYSGLGLRLVFWLASIPAVLAVALLFFGLREPAQQKSQEKKFKLRWEDLKRLRPGYWWVVILGACFTLARFSEAFLVLRLANLGLRSSLIPTVFILMNVVYAITAYPFGKFSDRGGSNWILFGGIAALVLADLLLARAASLLTAFLGVAFWGLHMGMTKGIFDRLVADFAPAQIRASAFGFFHLVSGIAILFASLVAGYLWDARGPSATFLASFAFALASLALFLFRPRKPA
jgi:MFS family permease